MTTNASATWAPRHPSASAIVTQLAQRYHISPSVRLTRLHEDGRILFDVDRGRIFAIDRVGGHVLDCVARGLTDDEITREMREMMSSDSSARGDVTGVRQILSTLASRGFIRPGPPASSDIEGHRTSRTRAFPLDVTDLRSDVPVRPGVVQTCLAWMALAGVDVFLHTFGFGRLRRVILRWKPRGRARSSRVVLETCAAVDRASIYFYKRTMCLQRSFAITALLRSRGVPADLVIGCRKIPFYAHAWVEVGGLIVNDKPNVAVLYPELERL